VLLGRALQDFDPVTVKERRYTSQDGEWFGGERVGGGVPHVSAALVLLDGGGHRFGRCFRGVLVSCCILYMVHTAATVCWWWREWMFRVMDEFFKSLHDLAPFLSLPLLTFNNLLQSAVNCSTIG